MSKYEEKLGVIKIGLRRDLVVTRQEMGGQPKYVMHDPLAFQNHVLSRLEYQVVSGIVATRTLAENFDALIGRGVMEESRRDEFYEFVLSLHDKNLLQLPMMQADAQFKRYEQRRDAKRSGWYRAALYFHVPLLNPDRFLNQTLRYVSWLFTRTGLALWTMLMLAVAWSCLGRFGEMFEHSAELLNIHNLPLMWIALVLLKVIHEFGHAYACKRFGGEVPQMGLAFIVLTPCAFVDASASWKFPSRWSRITVAMAGMYVESIVAGLFALIWTSTQPGLLHDVALNVMVLASAITVLMNLNPLLKFDGYFVASDLLGVVNLRQRADLYLKSFAGHIALGLPRIKNSYSTWQKWVYGTYAPCSFLYKIVLAITITTMVVMAWPIGGALLGVVFAWLLILQPLRRLLDYLLSSKETAPVRGRSRVAALSLFVAAPVVLWQVPVSTKIVAPGVLEPMQRFSVRAPVSGFVADIPASHGSSVAEGDLLCLMQNPELEMKHLQILGEMEVEKVRLDAEEAVDVGLAETFRARLKYLTARSKEMQRRIDSMAIRSGLEGTLVRSTPKTWLGRYVTLGQELFQVHSGSQMIRVVMTDHEVLRAHLAVGSGADVCWVSDPSQTVPAIVREIRRSSSRTEIPVGVTMLAGGGIYAQRTNDEKAVADQPFLHVFLEAENLPLTGHAGLTAEVRMKARVETLGDWLRRNVLGFYNAWRMS